MAAIAISDPWVDSKWIVQKYSVSYQTGLRWIKYLRRYLPDYDPMSIKNKGRGKRPYSMRRIPLSVLEEHIGELLNR